MSRRQQYLQFGDTRYATNMSWVGSWDEDPKEKPIAHQICPELARLDKLDEQEAKATQQLRQRKISAEQFQSLVRVLGAKRETACKRLTKLGYFDAEGEEFFEEAIDIPQKVWFNSGLGPFGRIVSFVLVVVLFALANICFAGSDEDYESVLCLAKNIYFEAAIGHSVDRRAVAHVVLNRSKDTSGEWPTDICEIVYEPSSDEDRPRACKFSWTCDGEPDNILPQDDLVWTEMVIIAWKIIKGEDHFDPTFGATHYVQCGIQRVWMKDLVFKTAIGGHCYYG